MFSKKIWDHSDFFKLTEPSFASYYVVSYVGSLMSGVLDERGLLYYIYSWFVWLTTEIFIIIHCITIYEDIYGNRDSMDAIRQTSVCCLAVITSLKLKGLTKYRHEFKEIKKAIDDDFSKANTLPEPELMIVAKHARAAKVAQNFWAIVVTLVFLSFPSMAIGIMLTTWYQGVGTKAMLTEFYIPLVDEKKYDFPYFELGWLYSCFQGSAIVCVFMAFDCFFYIALIHALGKLEVIMSRLRALVPEDQSSYDPEKTRRKLALIIEEHQAIYELCNNIQIMTAEHNFKSYFLNSIEITFTGYQAIQIIESGSLASEYLIFFFSTLIHVFVPCYISELLSQKSLEVSLAAYESGWERVMDRRLRVQLGLLMVRAQKPILMNTGLYPVNLDMFSTVVRTAWSYFTLVRNAKN